MNKKVALVSLYMDEVKGIPPLAPLYLATALKKNGFEPEIFHQSSSDLDALFTEIVRCAPDLVGMSVFTGYNNKKYIELSKRLKEKGFKIIWGNAHPSLLPERVLQEDYIDFVCIGEGEETLVELMKNLDKPENYKDIDGIGFKSGKDIVINKKRAFVNIDDYLIDWSLIDLEKYIVPYFSGKYSRTLALVTSRGCPYNCQFCYNLVFNNRRWRGHSAEKFVAHLRPIIEKYKINGLRFLDDNFFVDKERAFAIASSLDLPYFADSRVEYVNEDFVRRLRETKCQEIMFGFESGSDRIMKDVVQKGTGTAEVKNAVRLLNNSGIMASGSLIFGYPGETREEYKQTMKYIIELLEINPNLAFTCGWFLPYPGTGLYEKAKETGFVPPEKLADWDDFDRWRNDYKMSWIDWDYELPVKYSRKIIHLLALAYKRNIPFLKFILKKRVENLNFSWPVDIWFFGKLRSIYFGDSKDPLIMLVKSILVEIVRLKNKK